jgi:hypothetical protein
VFLDPHPLARPDIVVQPLKFEPATVDNHPMQHPNHEADASPFTMLAATIVLFAAFVAICTGCSSSAGAPAPGQEEETPPCYSADEPLNDSFLTTEPIPATAERFLVEGYIHHGDLDCMIVLPLTAIAGRGVTATFDYAYGWDMDVSLGYRDALGIRRTLHAEYDAWGTGVGTFLEEFPAEAVDVTLSIGQRTLNYIPDSTRYTIEVEIF